MGRNSSPPSSLVLFLVVENRIGRRVVVHLHLAIYLHVLSSSLDIFQELVDGCRKVYLLFEEYVELSLALSLVLSRSLRTVYLLFM